MSLDEPRKLTPVQLFWDTDDAFKQFGPAVEKVEEVKPAPKDLLAPESVISSELTPVPVELETPVPEKILMEEAADSENGQSKEPKEKTMPQESSSQSSSTNQTKSGSHAPPAPIAPPIKEQTPKN